MDSRFALPWQRFATVLVLAVALFAVTVQFVPNADAGGPAYDGPQTELTSGPAYFGPAPNPIPYCENPTYFDPFPENVNPIGSIDVTGAPNASVTTDGITMDFELTAEGAPGTQYPGFFPGVGPDGVTVLGGPSDQPKGVEMASEDVAVVTLSEPLFYSQWVFTDVDRPDEGFDVTPAWTDQPGAVVITAGDPVNSPAGEFDFTGSTTTTAQFNDTITAVNEPSGSINGRVQVDFIGAVTGITMARDPGSGQSGFAVGGGCSPVGVAKEVTSGPTWNGATYEVVYTIRIRNNLPSTATLQADVAAALAASNNATVVGDVQGIDLTQVQLSDVLADPAFSNVEIVSLVNESDNLVVNFPGYDGDADTNLLAPGQVIPAETEETFILTVDYTPDPNGPLGPACQSTLNLTNTAVVNGVADGVAVEDQSDNGADPDPGVDNGDGGVDDSSPVDFECPPAGLEIVKTVVEGPAGACPSFADGIVGDGDALAVTSGDTVTYCISVQNPGVSTATNVVVTDPMAPAGWDGTVGDLPGMTESTVSFDLIVDEATPVQNTASASGLGPNGALGPVSDTALIAVSPPAAAGIAITKTVLPGAAADCTAAVEGADEFVVGEPGDAVTWCITVTNTGETALTDIIVTDAVLGIADLDVLAVHGAGAAALLVGESISFAFDGNVPDAGQVNTVSVSATPSDDDGNPLPDYEPVGDDNDAEVGSTAVTIDKTVIAGPGGDCAAAVDEIIVEAGTTVTYCFTVTNTGSVSLQVIDIVDETLGVRVPIPAASQIIASGASVTVSIDAEAQDIVNTAEVTGTPVDDNGDPIPDAPEPTDDDDATVDIPANPGISLTKTVIAADASCADAVEGDDEFHVGLPGDAVLWCFTVTNTGDVPLTDVLLDDELLGLTNYDVLAEHGGGAPILDVEGSITFGIAGTVPEDGAVNTATVGAVASDPDGNPLPDVDPVDDTNTAEVGSTDVELIKTVVAGAAGDCALSVDEVTVPAGTPVTYCFTVTNTGSVDLQVAEITDDVLGVTVAIPAANQILLPDASVTVSIEVPAVAVTNTAEVTGTPLLSGDPIPGAPQPTDDDTAVVQTQTPMLDLVKTVVAGPAGTCPATLADGVAGPGDALEVSINDTVTYCMNVANTGEVDIDNVIVSDPMAPAGFDGAIGTLAAGAEAVVSFDLLVVSTTPLVNTASVTGDDPAGGQLPPDEDTAVIERPVPNPSVAISKTVIAGDGSCELAVEGQDESFSGQIGDAVRWCISVTNDGNVPLTDIIVSDDLLGITDLDVLAVHGGGAAVLLVGETVSFSFDGVVTEDGLVNTVSVSATPSDPDGTPIDGLPPVNDSNDAEVTPKQADLSLVKAVSNAGPITPGTSLTYTITVANAGPDEATGVSVTDVMPTGLRLDTLPTAEGWDCARNTDGWTCDLEGDLEAGATEVLTYTATATDVAPLNTALVNTATVSSDTEDPNPDDNEDTTSTRVQLPPGPSAPQLPSPAPAPAPPDEVLSNPPVTPPLALTGSNSLLLTALGSLMVLSGGVLTILGQRRRDDVDD